MRFLNLNVRGGGFLIHKGELKKLDNTAQSFNSGAKNVFHDSVSGAKNVYNDRLKGGYLNEYDLPNSKMDFETMGTGVKKHHKHKSIKPLKYKF